MWYTCSLAMEVAVDASYNNDNESTLRILHAVATIGIEINNENKYDFVVSTLLEYIPLPYHIRLSLS